MTHPRIIVALDVPSAQEALDLAKCLKPYVGMVKVGLEGFVGHGPALVRQLRALGFEVFLDLKLHDIPRTAEAAARSIAELDVHMLTVHASGGPLMIQAVCRVLPKSTRLLAITVLTSLDDAMASALGWRYGTAETALHLGRLALAHGAAGLVCSASELPILAGLGGVRVVPGVRSHGMAAGDQRRIATPAQAVAAGADWIVIGRPIVESKDPVGAVQAIYAELDRSMPAPGQVRKP